MVKCCTSQQQQQLLQQRCEVLCRLAGKTDMLERLYTCLKALQVQYEATRQDLMLSVQDGKAAAIQLALTGACPCTLLCTNHYPLVHT